MLSCMSKLKAMDLVIEETGIIESLEATRESESRNRGGNPRTLESSMERNANPLRARPKFKYMIL